MPSSRRLSVANPIILEVRPDRVSSSIAPSTPPTHKAVRFSDQPSDLVTGVTRPLARAEAWSLFYFEEHTRTCTACRNPQAVFRRGERLCDYGGALAKDVAQHVYHYKGSFYSTTPQTNGTPVSVEIPHEYDHVRSLVKALDPTLKPARPTVIHHTTFPTASTTATAPPASPRRTSTGSDGQRTNIILTPGVSSRKTVHRPRYAKVVLEEKSERAAAKAARAAAPATPPLTAGTSSPASTASASPDRRGTLYDTTPQRKKEAYRVEIREPDLQGEQRRRRGENRWQ